MENEVLSTTKYVVDNSAHVKINMDKLEELSQTVKSTGTYVLPEDIYSKILVLDIDRRTNYLLLTASLCFCFWGDPKWKIEYNGQVLDGWYGLCAAFIKTVEENRPILDFKYLAAISEADFADVLKGNVEIPLFKERLAIVREIGKVMVEKHKCDFLRLIREAKSDWDLVHMIVENFPSFSDKSTYMGKTIYFHKRAQVLASEIYSYLPKEEHNIPDLSNLTACAEYKMPQVLRAFNILEYDSELSHLVDNQIEIEKDSPYEVEIRANTVWAVEKLRAALISRCPDIDAITVDNIIWLLGQDKSKLNKPYHHVRSTAY